MLIARRETALQQLIQQLRQQFDDMIVVISMFINMDAAAARRALFSEEKISSSSAAIVDTRTTAALSVLQLSLHTLLQEEAVDPAPRVEESKLELDLDDHALQYTMAQKIGGHAARST